MDTQGSFFVQGKYIKGDNKSIDVSKGEFDNKVAPQSIDIGKKPPLLRGQSDRRFNKGGDSLLKTALKNNMHGDSPKNGPLAMADSFESLASKNSSEGSAEEESKRQGTNSPPKLRVKASSFRNPKPKVD